MNVTIYHTPAGGTSRKTLEFLREAGTDVTVIEYLKTPPSREDLQRLYARAGITAREGLRTKEPLAQQLGLTAPDVSNAAIIDAMVRNPTLIERPLVETQKGIRLCRPQDRVREIL